MTSPLIENLCIHGDGGEVIPYSDFLEWVKSHGRGVRETHLSWTIDGEHKELETGALLNVVELPDSSGFICFESQRDTENCYVLDAYGCQRYRLTVPWQLTRYDVPKEARRWFRGPSTHPDGRFGVTAWIEYAGDFYFELNYQAGSFLWGKEIRY